MAIRRFSTSNISGSKSSKVWDQETTPGYFESIATIIVPSGGSSSITFSNIPQNYSHLQLRMVHQEAIDAVAIQFNGDTGNNYTWHILFGDGTNPYSQATTSTNMMVCGTNYGSSGSNFGASIVDVLDYTNTSKYKTIRSLSGAENNTSFARVGLYSGFWRGSTGSSTEAITSIVVRSRGAGTLAQYSHFALYGIRGA